MSDFDWSFWLPIIIPAVITVVIGVSSLIMQRKNNALIEEQLAAANKKKPRPKPPWLRMYWPLLVMIVCVALSWLPYFLVDRAVIAGDYMTSWV
jgi:Na+/H+ antiporter NhaD/arsenite permease-like protein